MENSFLVGELDSLLACGSICCTAISIRECYCDVKRIPRVMPDDLLFKSVNKGIGTEFQIVVFCCSTGKSNTINRTLIVNVHNIAFLCGAVCYLCRQLVIGLKIIQLALNLLVCNDVYIFADRILLIILGHLYVFGRSHITKIPVIIKTEVILNSGSCFGGGCFRSLRCTCIGRIFTARGQCNTYSTDDRQNHFCVFLHENLLYKNTPADRLPTGTVF